jgi:hypothetical protein
MFGWSSAPGDLKDQTRDSPVGFPVLTIDAWDGDINNNVVNPNVTQTAMTLPLTERRLSRRSRVGAVEQQEYST